MHKFTQRFTAFLLLTVIAAAMPNTVKTAQAAPQITVTIDGVPVNFDTPPQVINDRVMVQIRPIAERLGCSVVWDDAAQTSYINQPDVPLNQTAEKSDVIQVYVNNKPISFPDQQPVNYNDHVMIPSRGVIEALGFNVDWDGVTQTQVITTGAAAPASKADDSPTLRFARPVAPEQDLNMTFNWNGLSFRYPSQSYTDDINENTKGIYISDTVGISVSCIKNDSTLSNSITNSMLTAGVIEGFRETYQLQNVTSTEITLGSYNATKTTFNSDYNHGFDGKGILVTCTSQDWMYSIFFIDAAGTSADLFSKIIATIKIS